MSGEREQALATAVLSDSPRRAMVAVPLIAAAVWAYWPTLVDLVGAWERQPDYSHGYLVGPLALAFLWVRRDAFPGLGQGIAWWGLLGIAASAALRWLAGRYSLEALDAWSILPWLGGVAWLLGGWSFLRWAAPSIAFLFFAIPLPFRAERWAALPLQRVATHVSTWFLQLFGQPALAEGNIILLGEHELEVAQACSGLRILVGTFALAFACVILTRRAFWEKVLLLVAAVPVALVANSARVVATGLLYQYASSDAARRFSHDMAGWVMIPLAAALFALVLWYLGRLAPEVEAPDVRRAILRHRNP